MEADAYAVTVVSSASTDLLNICTYKLVLSTFSHFQSLTVIPSHWRGFGCFIDGCLCIVIESINS